MKKRLKEILPYAAGLLACLLVLAFTFMPFPASGLTIRLYFEEFQGDGLVVYYTTDENPNMGMEQIIVGTYDAQNGLVAIRLSSELADHVDRIRLDFPETEQVISVRNVSVSSAGVIRHHYDPCDFFSDENVAEKNDVPLISLIDWEKTAYIQTKGTDPYILFDRALVRDVLQYRSAYRLTRFAACMLAVLLFVSYRIRSFAAGTGRRLGESAAGSEARSGESAEPAETKPREDAARP